MKQLLSVMLLSCAVFCGCQAPQPVQKLETSRVFPKPIDAVWPKLVQVATDSEYPLKVVQKDSGVIETENFSPGLLRGIATSPHGLFLPTWGATRARLSILATPLNETNTTVKVTGHFEAFEDNVTQTWYVWDSTGQFEYSFLNKVQDTLR